MAHSMRRRLLLMAVVGVFTLAADQVTKHVARTALKGKPAVVLVEGYLDFEYHENPGAAFGMLRTVPGARYILLGAGVLALVLVWTMVRRVDRSQGVADIGFGLVVGGALGNFVDRALVGRVSDFVLMHWNRKYIWPAYNVADVALVAGVILLLWVLARKPQAASAPRRRRGK